MPPIAPAVSQFHLTTAGTYVLQGAPGTVLYTVNVNTGAASSSMTIYDNTAASGTVVSVVATTAMGSLSFGYPLTKGCTVVIAGGNPDVLVTFGAPTVGGQIILPVPVSQGGTGSGTQNFVDLTNAQTVAGAKNFTAASTFAGKNMVVGASTALGDNGVGEIQLATVTTAPTTNPTGGVVVYCNSGGHLTTRQTSGIVSLVSGVLSTTTSTTTIASSNALTALQAFTIPSGDPIGGSTYRMTGYGVYSVTGTPTLTFALYWGGIAGTAIAVVPAITAASGITNAPFHYTALVNFRSSTSCTACIQLSLDTSASTDVAAKYIATPTAATTVTTNVNSDLTMGFTWSASDPANTISLLGGNVELVR